MSKQQQLMEPFLTAMAFYKILKLMMNQIKCKIALKYNNKCFNKKKNKLLIYLKALLPN